MPPHLLHDGPKLLVIMSLGKSRVGRTGCSAVGQQPGHRGTLAKGLFSRKPLLAPQAHCLGSPGRARVEKTGKDQARESQRSSGEEGCRGGWGGVGGTQEGVGRGEAGHPHTGEGSGLRRGRERWSLTSARGAEVGSL